MNDLLMQQQLQFQQHQMMTAASAQQFQQNQMMMHMMQQQHQNTPQTIVINNNNNNNNNDDKVKVVVAAPALAPTAVLFKEPPDAFTRCICGPCAIVSHEGCTSDAMMAWFCCLFVGWPWWSLCCWQPKQIIFTQ